MFFDLNDQLGEGQAITRYLPPGISQRSAERSRRLTRPRAPIELLSGLSLGLCASHPSSAWHEMGRPIEITFSAGGETGHIRTVVPLLKRVLSYGEIELSASETDAELSAFLTENVLVERISELEELLGFEIGFLRIGRAEPHEGFADLSFSISHTPTGMEFPGIVFGSAPLLATLARHWESRQSVSEAPDSLRFAIACRAGCIDLTHGALAALAPGDAMLFDRIAVVGGVAVILQERFHALARFDENGAPILSEPFTRETGEHKLGDFIMDEQSEDHQQAAIGEAQIDDLPVRLVFEIGRMDLTVDEVRSLQVGTPVPLERAASSMVDIFANGRRVGWGEMIMIGDQLGVRVTGMVGHA